MGTPTRKDRLEDFSSSLLALVHKNFFDAHGTLYWKCPSPCYIFCGYAPWKALIESLGSGYAAEPAFKPWLY